MGMKLYVYEEFNDFRKIADEIDTLAGKVVEKTIADIHAEVDREFSLPKSGSTYVRGQRVHQASAPGEAPAIDYGNLMGSVEHAMTEQTTGEVAVGADYGLYLEMGTRSMEPRPFLVPAVETVWPEFVKAMDKVIPG